MDTDYHYLYKDNKQCNLDETIYIGNHVWIGCRSTILKGVTIADDCVVGACSNVVRSVSQKNTLLAGNPAKIIKEDIEWHH